MQIDFKKNTQSSFTRTRRVVHVKWRYPYSNSIYFPRFTLRYYHICNWRTAEECWFFNACTGGAIEDSQPLQTQYRRGTWLLSAETIAAQLQKVCAEEVLCIICESLARSSFTRRVSITWCGMAYKKISLNVTTDMRIDFTSLLWLAHSLVSIFKPFHVHRINRKSHHK